jgi:predicted RNA methylase
MALNKLADSWFDLAHGTETLRRIESRDLSTTSENKRFAVKYVPTNARAFATLLQRLDIPTDWTFVDVGAGKGRVLLLALRHGFRRVAGIEFSGELCEIARQNVSQYCERHGIASKVEIIEADATTYAFRDDQRVFYLFDPFGAEIVAKVMANLADSLARAPREIRVIYATGSHRDVIESRGDFRVLAEHRIGGYDFVVYVGGGRTA